VSGEASGPGACLYVISCRLDRVKIGVAGDARKRLRELQVGSPVELKLAHIQPYRERRDAVAVAEELYRYFAGRRVHGSWYRLTVAEVREGLSRRATLEAPTHARAAEAAAREGPRRGERVRARTEKQRAYERRRRQERTRKQKLAARLLGQRMTQEQTALAVGVTSRTLRNWKAAPAFRRELERQHKRHAPPATLNAVQQRQGARPPRRGRQASRSRRTGPTSSPARARQPAGPARPAADDRRRR
jgi:hypothetical protein